jgi:hypothetical protein
VAGVGDRGRLKTGNREELRGAAGVQGAGVLRGTGNNAVPLLAFAFADVLMANLAITKPNNPL